MHLTAHRLSRPARPLLAALAAVAALALPGLAEAGYAVYPNGQTFTVQTTSWGSVESGQAIDFVIYLDELDSSPYIWVSESPLMSSTGLPLGVGVGSCNPYDLQPVGEPGKWVCRESAILMQPGRTYYWWLDFRRRDTADYFGQQRVSGPFSFSLVGQAPAPPPPRAPAPPPLTFPDPVEAPASTKTVRSAATLRAAGAYEGGSSVKHTQLGSLVYRTMKQLRMPRTLAVACWNDADWVSVLDAEGDRPESGGVVLRGFWKPSQPRWLHLSPGVCADAQGLLDSGVPTGRRAGALSTVLHEALHAHGYDVEAEVNCYAVQLVPLVGWNLELGRERSAYLGRLAVRYVRSRAPARYWDASRCRDGGPWDLWAKTANLR